MGLVWSGCEWRGRVGRSGRAHFVCSESCNADSSRESAALWFGGGLVGVAGFHGLVAWQRLWGMEMGNGCHRELKGLSSVRALDEGARPAFVVGITGHMKLAEVEREKVSEALEMVFRILWDRVGHIH